MNSKEPLKKIIIPTVFFLFFLTGFSQKTPTIKHLDEETIDEIKVDFDNDGDQDVIIAGVFIKKNQGRVYAIKKNGLNYSKPEYLFSFPSIGRKQEIKVTEKAGITTITVVGTSPTGSRDEFIGTLKNGDFQGVIIPTISAVSSGN